MEISDAMLAAALIKVKSSEIAALPDEAKAEHIFSRDFEKKMDALISSFGKRDIGTSAVKNTLTKAAVIFLTLCIGAFSLIMMNPQARGAFTNAVIEFYENNIKFYFISGEEDSRDFRNYENVYASYIPEGFVLKEKYTEYEAVGYRYENERDGLSYDIFVSLNEGLSVHTDKNKDNIEGLSISGREAYIIVGENEGKPYSTLIITGNSITVTVYGKLTREEIIRVGESLKEE